MNKNIGIYLLTGILAATLTIGCSKKEGDTTATSESSATATSATATSATDTSATTSTSSTDTMSTSGTTDTSSTANNGLTATSGSASASLNSADHEFVTKAAQGGMAEVALGNLAAQKATNADVKAFGQKMVTDHGQANDELKQLAGQKSVTLPADMGKHQADIDKLTAKSGKDFDKDYVSGMVKDHEEDVKEFEKASKSATDPDVKAWAAKTLPTLQMHLKMIKDIKSKMK
jgi:putative membrane protein